MKRIFGLILLNLISINVFSTLQFADELKWNQDTFALYESPLELIPNITEKIVSFVGDLPISSACWRGFVAEWRIIGDELFLTKVYEGASHKSLNKTIEKILGRKFKNGLIKADWVNGDFWCGKDLVREKTLYILIFENEYKLSFTNGIKAGVKECHFKPCSFIKTEDLAKFIVGNMDWEKIPLLKNVSFHLNAYLESDSTGRVTIVKLYYQTYPSDYNDEFIRVLKQIPCIPVHYHEGQFYDVGEQISIRIEESEFRKFQLKIKNEKKKMPSP